MTETLLRADSGSLLSSDSNPLPYYTVYDVVRMALVDCGALGIGMSPQPEDFSDALFKLNGMVAQWRRKRWLNYHLLDLSIVSTGALSYQIGPLGTLETDGGIYMESRPDRIEGAYIRQLVNANFTIGSSQIGGTDAIPPSLGFAGPVDYPLKLLQSREQYSRIALKSLLSFPNWLFYDPGYPVGTLYPWPLPQNGLYELHVLVKQTLSQYTSLSSQIILPEEYIPAMHWNLVVRLAPGYKQPLDPAIVALAKDALNTLRMGNTAIGELAFPINLTRTGVYNPYSDQIL